MPCSQANYLRYKKLDLPAPTAPSAAEAPSGKILVYSNAPETLGPQATPSPTLYKCTLAIAADDPRGVRVAPWHQNDYGQDVEIGVFVSVESGSCTLVDRAQESHHTGEAAYDNNLGLLGVCIAKIQLYQTFPPAPGNLNITTAETLVWSILTSCPFTCLQPATPCRLKFPPVVAPFR